MARVSIKPTMRMIYYLMLSESDDLFFNLMRDSDAWAEVRHRATNKQEILDNMPEFIKKTIEELKNE